MRGVGIWIGYLSIVKCCDFGGGIFLFLLDFFCFVIFVLIVDLLFVTTVIVSFGLMTLVLFGLRIMFFVLVILISVVVLNIF